MPGPFDVEREEVDRFIARQVSDGEAFVICVRLGGRAVSAESLFMAELLTDMRFFERPGCLRLLVETEREYLKHRPPGWRDRILEEVEGKFCAYYRALEEGGCL